MNPFESVRIRKDGSQIHVSVTKSPIKNRMGKIVGASVVARDISERRQAEEDLQKLQTEIGKFVRP